MAALLLLLHRVKVQSFTVHTGLDSCLISNIHALCTYDFAHISTFKSHLFVDLLVCSYLLLNIHLLYTPYTPYAIRQNASHHPSLLFGAASSSLRLLWSFTAYNSRIQGCMGVLATALCICVPFKDVRL